MNEKILATILLFSFFLIIVFAYCFSMYLEYLEYKELNNFKKEYYIKFIKEKIKDDTK